MLFAKLVKVSHAKTSSVIHNQGQKFACVIFVAQKYWQNVAVRVIAQFCQLTYGQCKEVHPVMSLPM